MKEGAPQEYERSEHSTGGRVTWRAPGLGPMADSHSSWDSSVTQSERRPLYSEHRSAYLRDSGYLGSEARWTPTVRIHQEIHQGFIKVVIKVTRRSVILGSGASLIQERSRIGSRTDPARSLQWAWSKALEEAPGREVRETRNAEDSGSDCSDSRESTQADNKPTGGCGRRRRHHWRQNQNQRPNSHSPPKTMNSPFGAERTATPLKPSRTVTEAMLTEENLYGMEQDWSQPADWENTEMDTQPPQDCLEEEEAWLERDPWICQWEEFRVPKDLGLTRTGNPTLHQDHDHWNMPMILEHMNSPLPGTPGKGFVLGPQTYEYREPVGR